MRIYGLVLFKHILSSINDPLDRTGPYFLRLQSVFSTRLSRKDLVGKSIKNTRESSFSSKALYSISRLRALDFVILSFTVFSSTGCIKISGGIKSIIPENDFLKTEFVVGSSQPADGVSNLLVGLQIKNSDNSAVASYRPELKVQSGGSVITSGCTESDKNGISLCILKSVVAGNKVLVLTNAKVGLTQMVTFTSPTGAHFGSTVSASNSHLTTNAGSTMSASFGEAFAGGRGVSSDGHVVKFGFHALRSHQ